jgi:hypothetical protein
LFTLTKNIHPKKISPQYLGAGQPWSNQIYLVTLTYGQLTQASFLQKNQMLQNGFLIFVTLRWQSGVENHEIWTFKVIFLCPGLYSPYLPKCYFLQIHTKINIPKRPL